MKRQELKALLHGVENSGEIIDQIMEINSADIENARKNAGTEVGLKIFLKCKFKITDINNLFDYFC